MNLPTNEQGQDFFTQYAVPNNIKAHCLKVQEVSLFLAKELQKAGEDINLELVGCLGLLHDLFKMVVLKDLAPNKFHQYPFTKEEIAMREKLRARFPGKYEGEIAYEIFKKDYPELALSLKRVSDPWNEHPTGEELVVHYADMRVFKEMVVSLVARLNYLQERYPSDPAAWKKYALTLRQQEQGLFSKLPFPPEQLAQRMNG